MVKIINMKGKDRVPDGAKYIGRTMPRFEGLGWGNPIVLKREADRGSTLVEYEGWLKTQDELLARRKELEGYDLACWCFPRPCHGEILAEVVAMDDDEIALWKSSGKSCLDINEDGC